jgi:hypothetical protein
MRQWDRLSRSCRAQRSNRDLPQPSNGLNQALRFGNANYSKEGLHICVAWLNPDRWWKSLTGADCCQWMREAGLSETRVEQLTAIESMLVGIK